MSCEPAVEPERSARVSGCASPPGLERPAGLLNRNVTLLWAGQFISEVGSASFFVAMLFWLKHETGSAAWMGALGMLGRLPSVVLAPLGGVVADRYPRRGIMLLCDLLDGAVVLGLGLLLWLAPGTVWALAACGLVCLVNEVTNAFFLPAQMAALPDLVPPHRLAAANTIEQCTLAAANFSGTLLGGLLLGLTGAATFFMLNAASYFVSLLCLLGILIPLRGADPAAREAVTGGGLRADFMDTFRFLKAQRGLLIIQLGGLVFTLIAGVVVIMLPFYVEDVLGKTAEWFGLLAAASGLGFFAGMALAGWRPCDGRTRLLAVAPLVVTAAAGMAVLGVVREPGLALALICAGGVVGGFLVIQSEALVQLAIPTQLRGRVLSLLNTGRTVALGLGMGGGGLLGAGLVHNVAHLCLCCAAGLLATGLAVLASPSSRAFLSQRLMETTASAPFPDAPEMPSASACK